MPPTVSTKGETSSFFLYFPLRNPLPSLKTRRIHPPRLTKISSDKASAGYNEKVRKKQSREKSVWKPKETPELRVLGLSKAENRTLVALAKLGDGDVGAIAFESGIPRTTTYSALRRLGTRRLVRLLESGKKTRWRVSRLGKLNRLHRESLSFFGENLAKRPEGKRETLGEITSEKIGIRAYSGTKALERAYFSMLELAKGERVLVLQGNPSAKASLGFSRERIFELHRELKRRHIILQAVMGENVLEIFRSLDKEYLESHHGRLVIASLLPDRYMDFPLDILVLRDKVIFASLEKEIVVSIEYPPLLAFLKGLISLAEDTGKRIDLNTFVAGLIEEKEGKA